MDLQAPGNLKKERKLRGIVVMGILRGESVGKAGCKLEKLRTLVASSVCL